MAKSKVRQVPFVQSLDRGLRIVHAVALAGQPVSLGELTKLDRSNVLRLANTLRRRGFLTCPAGKKDYILGSSMWRLSYRYNWGNMLFRVANQQLKLLAAQLNETAHLAIQEGKYVLFIDQAAGNNVVTVAGRVGELAPLYCTAHGKALLADADEQELRALLGSSQLRRYTKNTLTSIQELSKKCALVKKRGWRVQTPNATNRENVIPQEMKAAAAAGSVAKWEAPFAFQLFHRPVQCIAPHLTHRIALIADQRAANFVAFGT